MNDAYVKQADEQFGGIDILVSNAAANPAVGSLFDVCFWYVIISSY